MKILKKFALFLAAVMSFAPVVPAMAQAVTLSDSSTATSVVVTREVTGVKNPVTATFGYSLAESKNNPAVIGGLATGFDISFNSVMPNAEKVASVDYNLDLSSLTFTKVGDYVITLKEVSSSDDANYPVDTSDEYEILISVRNQLDDDGYPTGDLTVTLIPQVVNKDGDKTDVALFNSRADRTFIELEKYVSGDNADLGEYFKFRIDFTNATEGDVFTISGQDSTVMYHGDTIVTQSSFVVGQENYVYLKDGQKIELGIDADDYSELPIGLSYSITELDVSDYDTYIDGATENNKTSTTKTTESRSGGQMMLMNANTISQNFTSFENVKNTSVATGVNSVILPFVIIALLGVVSFAIYFAISKRKQ